MSNIFGTRKFSICNNKTNKLNPYFVTGFADGEGCFAINIYKDPRRKTGWEIKLSFSIHLHKKDLPLLSRIKSYFVTGNISSSKAGTCTYYVNSPKDLAAIIDHFGDEYPLITKKRADYLLFKMAVNLINNKEHLTKEGFNKILSLKASMNFPGGLSNSLKAAFPSVSPAIRPEIKVPENIDPNWLAGFHCWWWGLFWSEDF